LKIKIQALSIGLFENSSSPPLPTLPQTISLWRYQKTHLLLRIQLQHPLLHLPVSKSNRPTPALQQFLEDWPKDWPAPGSSS
jgi:hypothetical protein